MERGLAETMKFVHMQASWKVFLSPSSVSSFHPSTKRRPWQCKGNGKRKLLHLNICMLERGVFNELIESVSSYSICSTRRNSFYVGVLKNCRRGPNGTESLVLFCRNTMFLLYFFFFTHNTLCAANFPPDLPLCLNNPCSPFHCNLPECRTNKCQRLKWSLGVAVGEGALGQTYRVSWQHREGGVVIQKALIRPIMALTVETRVRN